MDLFIMRRYGEESTGNQSQQDHLASLLSKIEKRKKIKENSNTAPDICEPCVGRTVESVTEIDKKVICKKRKLTTEISDRKSRSEPSNLANGINETSNEDFVSYIKQKKSKICDELELNSQETEVNEDVRVEDAEDKNEKLTEFTVIGINNFEKRNKVKQVLPYWLANPFVMSGNFNEIKTSVHDIPDLDKTLVQLLQRNKIEYFFPVQCHVIPWLLNIHKRPMQYRPNDLCVSSPTGSGKTLSFVLPIIQVLKSRIMRHIRALVILPAHELALQIYEVFNHYCKGTDLKVLLLSGQRSFASEQQQLVKTSVIIGQYNAVDIIVTTPGRLVSHIIGTPGFSLKYLRFLVIDEADKVMEYMESDWLYHVEKLIYGDTSGKETSLCSSSLQSSVLPPPQKLLFSATLTQNPEKLEQLRLFQPKLFTTVIKQDVSAVKSVEHDIRGDFIGKYTTPAELTEKFCVVNPSYKPLILYHLIKTEKWRHVLCFTKTLENTHRLALLLKNLSNGAFKIGQLSAALHAKERDMVLKKFSTGDLDILISTDALARGVDFPHVDYVVSYDAPKLVKTYIHRVGRTARAGKLGTSISLLTDDELRKFQDMLQKAHKLDKLEEIMVAESELEGMEEQYQHALNDLQYQVNKKRENEYQKNRFLKNFKPV